MLDTKYQSFYDQITKKIPQKRVFTDKLHTFAYGTDASFYRLVPKIVIKTDNAREVNDIISLANSMNLSITFRAGGTSLSGQAISDSILIITSRKFSNFKIASDASYISLEPALTGAQVNGLLSRYSKKIGPDPASINAAMIGGIAANNASGMCCGISQNSYKTLKSMKLIFADGTKLDTACEESKNEFRKTHADFLKDLKSFSDDTKSNEELRSKIERKFKIKNTCGYSLNALIDFDQALRSGQNSRIKADMDFREKAAKDAHVSPEVVDEVFGFHRPDGDRGSFRPKDGPKEKPALSGADSTTPATVVEAVPDVRTLTPAPA